MTRAIVFRPQARDDLLAVWTYTYESWGADQADCYVRALNADVAKLAAAPAIGSDRSEVRPGLRKFASARHAIYYYYDVETLRVTRVLHGRMYVDADVVR